MKSLWLNIGYKHSVAHLNNIQLIKLKNKKKFKLRKLTKKNQYCCQKLSSTIKHVLTDYLIDSNKLKLNTPKM